MRNFHKDVLNTVMGSCTASLLLCLAMAGASFNAAYGAGAVAEKTTDAAATAVAEGAESTGTIETVVVTAMKRGAESVQATANSIGVLGSSDLSNMNVTQFSDFSSYIAGLNFVENGPGDKRYIIRGMNSAGEAQTAVYYDNIPTTGIGGSTSDFGGTQPDLDLYDMQQIEVLRGPQGTLYGSNSQSGVIHFVTNKPDASGFSADMLVDVSATHDGGENYAVHGMINVPLIKDKLAARLVVSHSYDDGFIDNVARGEKNINDTKTSSVRASVKWNIDSKTSLLAQYFYEDLKAGGRPVESLYDYTIADTEYSAAGSRSISLYAHEPRSDTSNVYALTFKHDFGWADLTVSSSDFRRSIRQVMDYTNSFNYFRYLQDTEDYPSGVTIPDGGILIAPQRSDLWSNEARISTKLDSRVNGVFGVFYSYRLIKFENHIYGLDMETGEPDYSVDEVSSRKFKDRMANFATFGEVTYDVTDALSVTGGIRYYDTIRHLDSITLVPFFNQSESDGLLQSRSKDNGEIYKASVKYRFTKDIMAYFTYAQGFRAGGTNASSSTYVPSQYGPDKTDSFEIGLKSEWWDHKIQFNVALYHIILSDLQVTQYYGPGNAFSGIGNVDGNAARSNGGEFDFTIKPIDGLTLKANGSYTKAVLLKDLSDTDIGEKAVKGVNLLNVPKVNFSLRADYAFSITDRFQAIISGDMSYTGKVKYHTYDEYNEPTPSYALFNMHGSLMWDNYDLTFYVKNVFDKNAQLNVLSDVNDPYDVMTNQPRTIGLRLGVHW